MNYKHLTVLAASFIIVVGCNSKSGNPLPSSEKGSAVTVDDIKRDAATTLETTAKFSQQSKDKLLKELKGQMAAMDDSIEKLRLKGDSLASDAKVKWELKMSDLDNKRKAANDKLAEIENSTAEAWGDVEKGALSAWDDLKIALQNASNEF
jgi:TolA-binding protein